MPEKSSSSTAPLNSAEILREARRLQFLVHPRALAELAGAYHGARPGTGLTFAELRPYEPGDDVRHIDWNVSARQQRPYVRHYTEERALTLWLAVDLSAGMKFGQVGKTKADRACQAAALLAAAAIQNGDKVGLLLVGTQAKHEVRPGSGLRHLSRLMRSLVEADAGCPLPGPDLLQIPNRFRRRTHRGMLITISDFRAPLDHHAWRRLAAHHQCLALRIFDPLEVELPQVGLIRAIDPMSGKPFNIDTSSPRARALYREDAARRDTEFKQFCRETRVFGWDLSTTDDPMHRLQLLFRESQLGQPTGRGAGL